MELITGGDLYDYIVQRKSLTEEEAAKIIKAILKAVEHRAFLQARVQGAPSLGWASKPAGSRELPGAFPPRQL